MIKLSCAAKIMALLQTNFFGQFFVKVIYLQICFLLCFLLYFYPKNSLAHNPSSLTILAEENMAYALTEMARQYSKSAKVLVSVNFSPSFQLIQDINLGEPADIFISSNPEWMEALKQRGLVDVYNFFNLAWDKLLIITSSQNEQLKQYGGLVNKNIQTLLDKLASTKSRLVLDLEYSSLGRYEKLILTRAAFPESLIYQIEKNKTGEGVIDFIKENNYYCAMVFASQVKGQKGIVVLGEIEDPVVYYQALVVAGDNMAEARNFLAFLKSETAQKILLDNGFRVF